MLSDNKDINTDRTIKNQRFIQDISICKTTKDISMFNFHDFPINETKTKHNNLHQICRKIYPTKLRNHKPTKNDKTKTQT